MALIDTPSGDGALRLAAQGAGEIRVADDELGRIPVTVWGDTVNAALVDPADAWLSDFLSLPAAWCASPMSLPVRSTDLRPAFRSHRLRRRLSLSADLAGLTRRSERTARDAGADDPLSSQPRRAGLCPLAEDDWKRIRIGTVTFRVAKPCSRCAIPPSTRNRTARQRAAAHPGRLPPATTRCSSARTCCAAAPGGWRSG